MLYYRTGEQRYRLLVEQLLIAFAQEITRIPISFSYALKRWKIPGRFNWSLGLCRVRERQSVG